MKSFIGAQKCETCKFIFRTGNQLFCRRNPPVPTPIIGADPQGRPTMLGCVANFPPMQPDQWCGEWVKGFRAEQLVEQMPVRLSQ